MKSKRIEELEKKKTYWIRASERDNKDYGLEVTWCDIQIKERKLAEKDFKKLELFRDNEIVAIRLEDWENQIGGNVE